MGKLEDGFLETANEEYAAKTEAHNEAVQEQHVVPEQGAGERYPSVVQEEEPEPEAKPAAKKTAKK